MSPFTLLFGARVVPLVQVSPGQAAPLLQYKSRHSGVELMSTIKSFSWLLVFGLSTNAFAETEYWISVGSFAKEKNAQAVLAKIKSTESVELIDVRNSETRIIRVALGPYLSEGIARARLPAVKAQYDGAWLWKRIANDASTFSSEEVRALVSFDTKPNGGTPLSFGTVPRLQAFGNDIPDTVDIPKTAVEKGRELVEEAPPGYQLHSLRRTR
ncbi:MAG: SPOR domain-containing protein [bacterium]